MTSRMSEDYCWNCGNELVHVAKFCTACGETVRPDDSAEPTDLATEQTNTMFKVTVVLMAAYYLLFFSALILGNTTLGVLGGFCAVAFLITMYVDLRDLNGRLWGTRPIVWVLGVILAAIAIMPLYVYKRYQVA